MTLNITSSAAENGPPSNTEATNHANQMNQFLGTGSITMVYPGSSIFAGNPTGNGQHLIVTSAPPNYQDRSQPFVMPATKTVIGRVTFPIQPFGSGSDMQVTLYPDNGSGSPDLSSPIVSTIVPKSRVTNTTIQGSLTTDVPPLVTVASEGISLQNNFTFPWSQPAIGPGGAASQATPTVSDLFMILSGGFHGSTASGTVATVQSLGGGFIGNPMLQPSIPQPVWYHVMTATQSTLLVAGGTDGVNFYKSTWTANWDPNTGVVGAWTAQADLPVPVIQGCAASWGDFVYVTGGNADLTPASSYNTVYYANAANGQIQSWTTASNRMPLGLQVHFAAAINGWLVICGGQNSAGATQSGTYYAKIKSNGDIGPFYRAQDMPVGVYAFGAQWSFSFSEDAMVIYSGLTTSSTYTDAVQTLPVMTNGVGTWWSQQTSSGGGATGAFQVALFPHGEPGNWQMNILETSFYLAADTLVVPVLSVPLPATGLTPGNTYHVHVHNLNEDLTNYTSLYVAPSVNMSPYVLRARYTNDPWTAQVNGFAFPLTIYDNTPNGGQPLHTWQDQNSLYNNQAQTASTFVYDGYGRVLGYCEAVSEPQDPLNLNTLTTNSTTNWTPTNATLTSSSAQTHGGYAFSGLLTPNGTSTLAYASSENITLVPGKPYTATAWFYAATAITSNISLSVNWFDSTGTYISTSSNTQSLGAATWTYFTNTYSPPAGAASATLVPTLSGTPSAGNPLYISYIRLLKTDPDTFSSVAEVTYDSTNIWGPTGVTQLN